MKKIIYASALVATSMLSCQTLKKSNEKQEINTQGNSITIDSSLVKKHLYTLASDEMGGRKPGTEGMEKATKYIENEFKRIGLSQFSGLETYRQNFTHNGIKMSNIIGVLEGKSKKDEFVIVSAHHDHLGTKKDGEGDLIFNGANDDASGVVGVLSLAEYSTKKGTNERSILFVCFHINGSQDLLKTTGTTSVAQNIQNILYRIIETAL